MLQIVKTISSRIKDGARLIKLLRFGLKDVQEVADAMPHGIDSHPYENLVAVYGATSEKGSPVVIGYLNKNAVADVGELRLYSTNGTGEEQMFIHLKNDGTAEFNGDADFLARFNELKSGFDQLKSDFNSLVTAYNTHIHVTTATVGASGTVGVISPTVSTGTPSSASIDSAKIDELKTS